jgi:hypothetical protein
MTGGAYFKLSNRKGAALEPSLFSIICALASLTLYDVRLPLDHRAKAKADQGLSREGCANSDQDGPR